MLRRQSKENKAAQVLAPQFTMPSELTWSGRDDTEQNVKRTQVFHDEKALCAMLFAIARGNPYRAAAAISKFLTNQNNKSVKDTVTESVFKSKENDKREKLVMEGIRT